MIERLLNNEVELRTLRPSNGRFSSMHAKSWVLDRATVIMGSSNATTNGYENNYEQCIMLHSPTHPLAGILTRDSIPCGTGRRSWTWRSARMLRALSGRAAKSSRASAPVPPVCGELASS